MAELIEYSAAGEPAPGGEALQLHKEVSTFLRIIRINEGIKRIAELSFHIRLRALNTLIVSLKNSEDASGIAVVSQEMIRYSAQLEQDSLAVTGITYDLLVQETLSAKSRKRRSFFDRALQNNLANGLAEDAEANSALHRTLEQFTLEKEAANVFLSGKLRELFARVRDLLKQCLTGRVLGTMTKIESAYSANNKQYFMLLAKDFEKSLNEVEEILKLLEDGDRTK